MMNKKVYFILFVVLFTTSCFRGTKTVTVLGCNSYLIDAKGQKVGYVLGPAAFFGEMSVTTKDQCGNNYDHSSYDFIVDMNTGEIHSYLAPFTFYTKTTTFDVSDAYVETAGELMPRIYLEIHPDTINTPTIKACTSPDYELKNIDASVYKYMWTRIGEPNTITSSLNTNMNGMGSKMHSCSRTQVGIPQTINPPLSRVEVDSTLG